ncbi:MAG: hydrolase TatD [Gammaproteobacteria bacterium]|nr:hydrolase TatD [Gammaproteobacteria bacterium]
MPAPLIDIGINLAHDSYDRDRAAVIERARAAGVAAMMVTGSTLASSARALELCRQWPALLRATAGVHPHHAAEFGPAEHEALAALCADPFHVAAGECGLDYYRNYSPPAAQRHAFAAQLELAARHRKPVFLHEREAHADFIAILRDWLPRLPRAVLHCFTGTAAELEACLAAGLSIGITGWICDERRGQTLRALVQRIPDERLMIETDGPYLLPRTIEPKPAHRRNEPMYLPAVLAAVAAARRQEPAEVARITTANSLRFFGLELTSTGLKPPD